jgi:hypothetical protein
MESSQAKGVRLLKEALDALREGRPDERSEFSRRYAILITMLEKAYAFSHCFIEDFINDG